MTEENKEFLTFEMPDGKIYHFTVQLITEEDEKTISFFDKFGLFFTYRKKFLIARGGKR